MMALYVRRLRDRKRRTRPTARDAKPSAKIVGSGEAVFGAIAPFENLVVCAGAGIGAETIGGGSGRGFVIGTAVSASVTRGFVFPAAESTHAFMSVSVMRPEESGFDLPAVGDARFAVSIGGLPGDGT
jgi:hypothetical protein